MRKLTFACFENEPVFGPVMEVLRQFLGTSPFSVTLEEEPAKNGEAADAGAEQSKGVSTENIPASAQVEIDTLWQHLYSGEGSRRFLREVARYSDDNDTRMFRLKEIDGTWFNGDMERIKAANRNVNKAMKKTGVSLFSRRWNYTEACMEFTISKEHVEAILMTAAGDSDLN